MKQRLIIVTAKTLWAKNRIKLHGQKMILMKDASFRGQPAFLARSMKNTSRGENWLGWFYHNEASFEFIENEEVEATNFSKQMQYLREGYSRG